MAILCFGSGGREAPTAGQVGPALIDSTEAEYSEQRGVHSPLFFRRQMTDQAPKSPHIDCAGLFDEHPSGRRTDLDFGSK